MSKTKAAMVRSKKILAKKKWWAVSFGKLNARGSRGGEA